VSGPATDPAAKGDRTLTIVMYHYVRNLAGSRHPRIKGLSLEDFRRQLDYIAGHYDVVRMENVIAAVTDPAVTLPPRAALLTFDDGLSDHYTNVLPLLAERGWQGSFFPPARPISRRVVLDVHKIHFTLAAVDDAGVLVEALFGELDRRRGDWNLATNEAYWRRVARASRFDPAEVILIKRMLQRELPPALRAELTDALFGRFVTVDERAFAAELYLSTEQLREMVQRGMYVGNHGATHRWLDTLSPREQEDEIDESLALLREIGAATERWVMCYPYGAHNDGLRRLLRARGCVLGLTTEVALADPTRDDPLALPRLDTNDLPRSVEGETPRQGL